MIIQEIESDKPTLYLRYRQGKELIEDTQVFFPYYWTDEPNGKQTCKTANGEVVYKKFYSNSSQRFYLKNKIKSWELDVSLENRYLIDNFKDLPEYKPRIMHIDIETDMGLDALTADKAILAITVWDSYENAYVTYSWKKIPEQIKSWDDLYYIKIYNSEKEMMENFVKLLNKTNPDIITGWNVIGYDIKYIINRMYRIGLDPKKLSPVNAIDDEIGYNTKNPIKGRICFDLLFGYKKLSNGDIGENTLKAVLEDNNAPFRKLDGMENYETDFQSFLEYNKRDVEGTVWIDEQFGIIDSFLDRQQLVGCKFTDTYYNKDMVDIIHLRGAKDRGIVLPTGTYHEKQTYEGATIINPLIGFYKNVVILDVKSMYPASMEAANMSFETINPTGNIQLGNGISFNSDTVGLTTSLLQKIQDLREEYKSKRDTYPKDSIEWKKFDNKQRTTKFLKNSFYGWMGYPGSRIYNPDIAASITWLSRNALAHIIEFVKSINEDYKIIYGHTDSIFVYIPEDHLTQNSLDAIAYNMEVGINQSWHKFEEKYNLIPNKYSIEIDNIAETFLLAGNNRYAIKHKDGYKIQGFETKKKSTSPVVKDLQERVLLDILNEEDSEKIFTYVKEIISNIRNNRYTPDEICIKKKLKKGLDGYKNNANHVSAAKWANEFLKTNIVEKDSTVKMIHVKRDNVSKKYSVKDDYVIAYETEEQIKEFAIDVETMIDKLIPGKLERIFDAMSWELYELLKEKKTEGFDEW